jgi:type II secretory pathway pseudopilin PulG
MNLRFKNKNQKGFTLVEAMVSVGVMSLGILSLLPIFTQGLNANYQTQIQFVAQQKAQEAMESIFTARDTRLVGSAQITNVSEGGIFLDGPQPLYASGPDGLYGTADDDSTNPDSIVIGPGPDQMFGTADDVKINLNPFMTRTIQIVPNATQTNLKNITITINWTYAGQTSSYTLNGAISNFD